MGVWEDGGMGEKNFPHSHTPTQNDNLKAALNFTDLCTAQ